MGLNGGGYTFLYPTDLPTLTNDEVQAMFMDKNTFLMRVRRSDTTQPYGVLTQLPQFQYVSFLLRSVHIADANATKTAELRPRRSRLCDWALLANSRHT